MGEKIILFLAGNPDLLQRFIAETSINPSDIKQIMFDQTTLAMTMDYMLHNEDILIDFLNNNQDISYESFYKKRANLPGFTPYE